MAEPVGQFSKLVELAERDFFVDEPWLKLGPVRLPGNGVLQLAQARERQLRLQGAVAAGIDRGIPSGLGLHTFVESYQDVLRQHRRVGAKHLMNHGPKADFDFLNTLVELAELGGKIEPFLDQKTRCQSLGWLVSSVSTSAR